MKRIVDRWHQLSLQWKSTLLLGVALALMYTLFGVIAIQNLSRSTDAAFQERLAYARMASQSVDDLIRHGRYQLESAAALPALVDGNPSTQAATLKDLVHVLGSFDALRLLDIEGRVLWETSSTPGEDMAASAVPQGQQAVAYALERGETVVAAGANNPTGQPFIAVIAVPVKDRQGTLTGVLQGELRLTHMGGDLVSLPQLSSTSRVSVIDRQGMVLASAGIGAGMGREAHVTLLEPYITQGVPGVAIHRAPWGDHVVAFSPLDSLGGGVVVEEQKDLVLAIPQRLRAMLLIFGSSTLLLVSLGAWLYIRRVIQPLGALTQATTAIAQGRLDNAVTIHRRDEIGEMGRSFESMRRQLVTQREERLRWEQELEERVKLRTTQAHRLMGKIISAQEEERKRIARDLHDGPAQSIATLVLHLTAVEENMPPTAELEPQRHLAREANAYAFRTLDEIRRLVQDLRPSALDDMGLVAGVHWYATSHLEAAGLQVDFRTVGEAPPVNSEVETAVFRILQEAITNAARHAMATRVTVGLTFAHRHLHASVEDNGTGFDMGKARSNGAGLGIVGMEERADLIGGRLTIFTSPGGGTRVELEVPLDG